MPQTGLAAPPPLPETPGQWHRRVLRLSGPIILSNLSVPLLGIVDTAVVGHLPDPAYIGAVAIGALIFSYLYWGVGFLRMGTGGLAAQAFGAGDGDRLRALLARALLLAAGLGLAIVAVQWPVRELFLGVIGASDRVAALAAAYYDIRVWSAPAVLVHYVALGWLIGVQRTEMVLVIQLGMNGVNIVLDLLFVVGFGWGVEGVAWATLIAEVLGGALGLGLVLATARRIPGRLPRRWARDLGAMRQLIRINADIFVRTLCLITAFSLFTALGARFGDVTLAANAVLMHFETFAAFGLDGFAHAAEALAGGAIGARRRAAYRMAVRVTTQWAAGMALATVAAYWLLGPLLVGLMTNLPEVRSEAAVYLPWAASLPLLAVWSFQLDGIFIGATRTREMRNGMVLSLVAYTALLLVLVPTLGNHGLWAALCGFMVARAATLGWWLPRIDRALAGAAQV